MNCCYIIGAGDFEGAEFMRPKKDDLLIAADGGLAHLRKINMVPDVVLGDFDSLPEADAALRSGPWQVMTFPAEKDYTDMMLAAETGFERGYREFQIFGGTGGRMDHTLANIQLLVNLVRRGCKAHLIGRDFILTAVHNGRLTFPASFRGYFSVYAFSDEALGVTEKGFQYGLEHFTLRNDDPRGISNEFCGHPGEISVEKGTLLICMERANGF